jgi:hypothetical protein
LAVVVVVVEWMKIEKVSGLMLKDLVLVMKKLLELLLLMMMIIL